MFESALKIFVPAEFLTWLKTFNSKGETYFFAERNSSEYSDAKLEDVFEGQSDQDQPKYIHMKPLVVDRLPSSPPTDVRTFNMLVPKSDSSGEVLFSYFDVKD